MLTPTASHRPGTPRHASAPRAGFSLTELIVAIVLMTVGLCALASTSVWLTTGTSSSRRTERAAVLALSRLELLRSGACTPAAGALTHGDLIERWSLSVEAGRAIAVVTVSPRDSGRIREQRYQTAYPC